MFVMKKSDKFFATLLCWRSYYV